jgi:hypothetical protein
MSRITEILSKARRILADKDKQRYFDDDLISLLNDGIVNWLIATRTLKLRAYVPLEPNTALYDLSPYSINIDRIQYGSKALEVKTEEEMDKIKIDWQDDVGSEPKYVIFDNLKQGLFRIYPKVDNNVLNNITQNSVYGGLIDITITDDLIQIPAINNIAFSDLKYLLIFYTGKPRTINIASTDDELDIDFIYDLALVSYISGQALRLDVDAQNRNFGTEQLQSFMGLAAEARKSDALNSNSFITREIAYRGAF